VSARALEVQLLVGAAGELLGARLLNGAGSAAPELEAELMRTRIIAPGRRAGQSVPVAFRVSVPLD